MPEQLTPGKRPRRRFRLRWLPRAVVESVLIIFSVVLALFLDDWREDRERADRVSQARSSFVREVCANRANLVSDTYLPFHAKLRATWRALNQLPNPSAADMQKANDLVYTGFHLISFKDAVWRSVSGSALMEHMDPDDVFVLADVYEQQELIDEMNSSMMHAWRQGEETSLRTSIQVTHGWLADVYFAELALLKFYDQALRELGAACPAAKS